MSTNDKPPPKIELQNEITEENLIKEGEELGFIFTSLKEVPNLKIDETLDQKSAIQCLEYKVKVKNFLSQKDDLLTDDEFIDTFDIKSSSSNEITEFVNKAIDRICTLKGDGNHVGANVLENKLIEKTKGKVKKTLIEREIAKKLQILYPNEYKYSFQVLGFIGRQNRNILVYHNKIIYPIPSKSVANPYDLKLLFGKEIDTDHVAQFIVEEAHKRGELENHRELRSGIWKLGKDWLAVSKGEILHISQEGIKYLSCPIYKKNLIKSDSDCFDLNKLKTSLEQKNNKLEQLQECFYRLRNYIAQWKFTDESMIDYATALVMLTLVQSAMSWRPWIYLRGTSGSGKSTFIETIIEAILGDLLKKLDKTTPYCIAQSVGNTTKALVLDEFEKNERNPEILETCKLMNKGGKITRGTPDEKEKSHEFHQMPWFASIYLPMTINSDEAQRNRLIVLELLLDRKKYSLETISPEEAKEIQIKMLDSLISLWDEIEGKAKEIKRKTPAIIEARNNKISARSVENFQYASALLSMITAEEYTVPKWAEQDQINDGKYILNRIIDSVIQDSGTKHTVISLINDYVEVIDEEERKKMDPYEYNVIKKRKENALRLLKQNAITIKQYKKEEGKEDLLGIDHIEVKHLIKRCEELKDCCIKSALLQIPRARMRQLRFESNGKWCVGIPISEVDV